jgi:MarR family transcriptional regulator, lower aerobic nicotinate degradation pathway regulator
MLNTSDIGPAKPPARIAKELASSTGFVMAKLGFRFKSQVMARLEKEDCELYHYSVLALLAEGSRQTQSSIAGCLSLDPSRLVAILDGLESDGLIARQRDPQDRRRQMVSITPAGEKQLKHLRAVVKEIEQEFFAPLDAADRSQLYELLAKLAAQNEPSMAFLKPPEAKTA